MKATCWSKSALWLLSGCLTLAGFQAEAAARFPHPLPAVPVGITLVNVVKVVGVAPPDYLYTRLGDGNGKTLYTYKEDTTPGVSKCTEACTKDFPPVLAGSRPMPFGDWSIVKRPEGALQWAYFGKPLYTYAKEAELPQLVDTLIHQGVMVDQGPGRGRELKPPPNSVMPPAAVETPRTGTPACWAIGSTASAVSDSVGPMIATTRLFSMNF